MVGEGYVLVLVLRRSTWLLSNKKEVQISLCDDKGLERAETVMFGQESL